MLFKSNIRETYLTQAVLSGDFDTLQHLGKYRDQVLAENDLKYNSIEMAQYLGKEKCLKHLRPKESKVFKVIPADGCIKQLNEEEFEKFFNVKYLSRFKFSDYFFFQKVLRSCSWVFTTEIFAEEPLELGKKYREGFFDEAFADVTIQWINDRLGWGVFADRDIEPQEFVGEYTGVVRQVHRFAGDINAYCLVYPKMMWGLKRFVIDSKYQGNEARFINHSSKPNLEIKMAVDRNLVHLLFFTNQKVSRGTQLTFNYGGDYWIRRGEPEEI